MKTQQRPAAGLNRKFTFMNTVMPYLQPHYIYLALSVAAFLITTIWPSKFDATIYHIDFKSIFVRFEFWRLITCVLVAGQFFRGFKLRKLLPSITGPKFIISKFTPYIILQSGLVQLGLCFWHLRKIYNHALSTKKSRELFLALGYVIGMIWLTKYITGSFLEEKTYRRIQESKFATFDGLFKVMNTIVGEVSFVKMLQYNIGIFPAYFMFTMAIVTLSSFQSAHERLNLRYFQLPYWTLPILHIAAQFVFTIYSPLCLTLLINNLAGFAIGSSYKALTGIAPLRLKLNKMLGTHLD